MPPRALLAVLTIALFAAAPRPAIAAKAAADQKQVAIGYERLETLALRIADAVEATDEARAEQIRTAIGEARAAGLTDRFDQVVRLLERQRYQAARSDQAELATQLEELLRLVMADPSESRLEEERLRLEKLRREIRAALREQRSLRARSERGEGAETVERQKELANRIERLREPAEEADRSAGRSGTEGKEGKPSDSKAPNEKRSEDDSEGGPEGESKAGAPSEASDRSIAGRLKQGKQAMERASEKLAEDDKEAAKDQRDAQRELEAAQREAEERLRQLREEEQQRRLASLAERFRRMHEAQVGLLGDTEKRVRSVRDDPQAAASRATRLAAAQLARRQGEVGSAAELALRLVRADGSSIVFDDALAQAVGDIRSVQERLEQTKLDATTLALEQSIIDALAEMIAAVDESLDELEKKGSQKGGGQPQAGGGDSGLVSKIAELRMIRSIQRRLMQQTEVWRAAAESGEATPGEVAERLSRLALEQRRLAASAEAVAKGSP